jgi:hypothetical protein
VELRKQLPALRRGTIKFVRSDDQAGFLAFERADEKDKVLVGFNRGEKSYSWEIPLAAGDSVAQIFTASGDVDGVRIEQKAGAAVVTVPSLDAVVLEVREQK